MKLSVFAASLGLSTLAFAQSAMPPGYNHPPMAGHPAPAGQAGSAPAPYQFRPPGPAMIPVPAPTNEATVVSSQSAGGYTYVEVTGPSGNVWLAAPETKLNAGDRVRYPNGAVMYNFSSKSINRTFPSITFVGSIAAVDKNAPPLQVAAAPMAQAAAAAPAASEGEILQVQDAGGYSYVEVKTAAGNTWLAAPMTKLKVGDKVRFEAGAEMRNFSSRALNRTFPSIQFVDRVAVVTAK